jgi:hypothetical protein
LYATVKTCYLPQIGLSAQAIRFVEFFSQDIIIPKVSSVKVPLPHPANFALHKLLVMGKRYKAEKHIKDKDAPIRILITLIDSKQSNTIRNAFQAMPKRWQRIVKKQLTNMTEKEVFEALKT